MVKRRKIQDNESSQGDEDRCNYQLTNSNTNTANGGEDGGQHQAEDISPRHRKKSKKSTMLTWGDREKSKLDIWLDHIKDRLRRFSRGQSTLVSWTLIPDEEVRLYAEAISGKELLAKTFKENISNFLQKERLSYIQNLRELSPKASRRNKSEVERRISLEYPNHYQEFVDKVQDINPVETPRVKRPCIKKTPERDNMTVTQPGLIPNINNELAEAIQDDTQQKDKPEERFDLVNSSSQEISPEIRRPPAKRRRDNQQSPVFLNISEELTEAPTQASTPTPQFENELNDTSLLTALNISQENNHSNQSGEGIPKERVYKSRVFPEETTLSSQDKAKLRRKIREGITFGHVLPQETKPKRVNPLLEMNTQQRFKYFLDKKSLPVCKRWDVNRRIPIDEINHLGYNELQKLIEKLESPTCSQNEYIQVNRAWPKIATAMMHTAQSYSGTNKSDFNLKQSKIVRRKKRMIRLSQTLHKAWKNRLNPSGKDKKLLAKMRIDAKEKHLNVKGLLKKVREEITFLEHKEKKEAEKAEGRKIRSMFDKSGSIKTVLQAGKTGKVPVKEKEAVKFFRNLLSQKITPPQLAIDEWVKSWEGRPITHDLDQVGQFLKSKLKYSRPFKTPGPNQVHPAAFKRFDSLARLLLAKVTGLLSGKFSLTEEDMTAQAFLLPKTDPPSNDPNDYRAINCINADIKYTNAVAYEYIYKNCFQYIATNQCAAFKGIPGTLHAMMVNYAILEQNPKATSVLYVDMKKAFDSVSHTAMKKAVNALNIPKSIKKHISGMLGLGGFTISNIIKDRRMKNNRVEIKQGIMQGCALAPCLFVVGMDIISYQLNKESKLVIGKSLTSLPEDYVDKLNHKFQNEQNTRIVVESARETDSDSVHLIKRADIESTNHISFVDDVKLFAKDNATIKKLKEIFESVALQLGLHVNAKKCGVLYNKKSDDQVRLEDIDELADCYKYLGIPELGRGISIDQLEKNLIKKITGSVSQVFKTKLNLGQKIKWYNSSIAPAVGYAVTHAFPAVRARSLPSLCQRLDCLVIKLLAGNISDSEQIAVRQRTTIISRLYCNPDSGGLGLKPLLCVAYESLTRHVANLWMNPINERVKGLNIQHELKGGKKTPLKQFDDLLKKILKVKCTYTKSGIILEGVYYDDVNGFTKAVTQLIKNWNNSLWYNKWIQKLDYAKAYHSLGLKMPWLKKAAVSDLEANLVMSSQQQSLPGLNWHINKRNNIFNKKCSLCQKVLNTSHILGSCDSKIARLKYTARHDAVLAAVTNSILKCLGAKYMPLQELRLLRENQIIGKDWSIGFDVPQLVEVGQIRENYEQVFGNENGCSNPVKKIAHNRPDLVLINHKLKKVILLEVAIVGNPRLIQQQVEIKNVRYMKNSQEVIGPDNYLLVNRAFNMSDHFKKKYGSEYEVEFVPFILGAYGEICPGFQEVLMKPLTVLLKQQHMKAMIANASRTAVVNTAYNLRFWLSIMESEVEEI
uniref:Reverse transcriptase domain-containing protein n=1 Tax=Strongyloides papillosus TaxID=174720 RepID=A0A0N5BJJ3_STREA